MIIHNDYDYIVINKEEDYKININQYKGDDITTYIKNCIEDFYEKHDNDFNHFRHTAGLTYNLTDIKKLIISANKDIQLQFEIDFKLGWFISCGDEDLTMSKKIIDVKHWNMTYDKVNEKWVKNPPPPPPKKN